MPAQKPAITEKATIEWQDGTPVSSKFDDIYFSPEDGIGESEFVFLSGIGAPEIWNNRNYFTIAETGFGTGLNFLLTMKKWLETNQSGRLCFISSEAYPLSIDDLKSALSSFPALKSFVDQLIAAWPPRETGFYQRTFAEGRVELLLMIGDAATSFAKLEAKVDAWYLDGFAPSKNPGMWSDALFEQIGYLSVPGARVATFTAAGFVKRALQSNGFTVTKSRGFGRKRERITAELTEASPYKRKPNLKTLPDWARSPAPKRPKKVTIIGAGIAGASLAYALRKRDVKVEIVSNGDRQAASHVPIAMLIPRISAGSGSLREFQVAAYSHAISHPVFSKHLSDNRALDYFPFNQEEHDKNQRLSLTINWGEEWFTQKGEILHLSTSGSINTGSLLKDLLDDTPIHNFDIQSIQQHGNEWHLLGANGKNEHRADHLVLANGINALSMAGFTPNDYSFSAGQVELVSSTVDVQDAVQNYAFGEHLSAPVAMPNNKIVRALGSSFEKMKSLDEYTATPNDDITKTMVADAELVLTRFTKYNQFPLTPLSSWRSIRTNTPDFMPYIGGVPDWDKCEKQYTLLKKDALTRNLGAPTYQKNLYILSGFGSKGYQYAPLAAEILAAQVTGETAPISTSLLKCIAPMRRLARSLIKN